MSNPRWTDETAELVAHAIHVADCEWSWDDCRLEKAHKRSVHAVLAALADAGLLVPADAETKQHWCIKWHDIKTNQPMVTSVYTDRADADRRLDDLSEVWGHHARLMMRNAITTPWTEVTS